MLMLVIVQIIDEKMIEKMIFIQILGKNTTNPGVVKRTKEEAIKLVKDVYMAACERNVELGDGVVIHTLTKDRGIETDFHALRKD